MTKRSIGLALCAAAMVSVAFVAGRIIAPESLAGLADGAQQAGAHEASSGIAASEISPATKSAEQIEPRHQEAASGKPPSLPARTVVHDRAIPSAWEKMVREDPRGARGLRYAVLQTIEARRRAAGGGRSCFDSQAIGAITLRFWVDVESSRRQATIGDAKFGEVHDGMAIGEAVADCLEEVLAGTDLVRPDETRDDVFHPDYRGPIEYRQTFVFATDKLADSQAMGE